MTFGRFGFVLFLATIFCDTGGSGSWPECVATNADCAATYNEQIEAARGKCSQLGWTRVYTYNLGGFLVYRRPGDVYPGATCAYDEGTGLFAGYEYCSDTPDQGGCFCRRVGRLPATDAGSPAGTLICPADGGSDSEQ